MDIEALAINASCGINIAQLHGSACGLSYTHRDAESLSRALVELWGSDQLAYELSLVQFCEAVLTSLESEDLEFELLTPDDDEAIGERSAVLGEWCENYLTGFGFCTPDTGGGNIGEDIQELISDFAAIAHIESTNIESADEDSEEAEVAYAELYEYVRVGVILVFTDKPEAGRDE